MLINALNIALSLQNKPQTAPGQMFRGRGNPRGSSKSSANPRGRCLRVGSTPGAATPGAVQNPPQTPGAVRQTPGAVQKSNFFFFAPSARYIALYEDGY